MEWFDIRKYIDVLQPFNVIIGGRGIGKTYSALSFVLDEGKPFIYLRNTDTQLQECSTLFGNPFKRINKDKNRFIRMEAEKKHYMIYDCEDEDAPELIGYGAALSTFENLRGIDLSDVVYVVFDEFIENRKLSFDQFRTFANFYETVNRNRELTGEDPLKVIMLSNAQRLDNPILGGYQWTDIIMEMIRAGSRERIEDPVMILLPESAVSEAKKKTANYRATKGSDFFDEAINNLFAHDSFAGVKKEPLQEYRPYCAVDGVYIYKHKSQLRYYATDQKHGLPVLTMKDNSVMFQRMYGRELAEAAVHGFISFKTYSIKLKLIDILII